MVADDPLCPPPPRRQPSLYSDDSQVQVTEDLNCGPYCESCGDCLACYWEDHLNGCPTTPRRETVEEIRRLTRGGYSGAEQE